MENHAWFRAVGIVLTGALVFAGVPGCGFAMPTESMAMVQPDSVRNAQVEQIVRALSHPSAQLHLRLAGIAPEDLRQELSKLDDAQLGMLAEKADTLMAGGWVYAILGVVVLVLVIILLINLLDDDDIDID